jgi:hypothetical protein
MAFETPEVVVPCLPQEVAEEHAEEGSREQLPKR